MPDETQTAVDRVTYTYSDRYSGRPAPQWVAARMVPVCVRSSNRCNGNRHLLGKDMYVETLDPLIMSGERFICTSSNIHARSESATLPNEIILVIIRACVEPYSLRLHQRVYTEANFPALLDDDHAFASKARGCLAEAPRSQLLMVPKTTVVITHFTQPGLEYLYGLPDVTNIKLVNKSFYHEISRAVKNNFTGTLSVETWKQFFTSLDPADWKAVSSGARKVAWLKPRITDVVFSENRAVLPKVNVLISKVVPNLKSITVRVRHECQHVFESELELLSGHADRTVFTCLDNDRDEKTHKWLDVSLLHRRNISLVFEFYFRVKFRFEVAGPSRSRVYCFRIETSSAGSYITRERRGDGDGTRNVEMWSW